MTDTAIAKTETKPPESFATPAVDVLQSPEALLLIADLPGVAKDGVQLRLEDDRLFLEARPPEGGLVYRRTFALEERYAADGIEAKLDDGVLRVHLPKPAEARPRQIAIQ